MLNMMQNPTLFIRELLLRIPVVLIALSVHEAAHAFAAYKLGDPTARNFGRVTLNPLKHLDPIGTLCLLLFRFGWARPVPVNSRYFKKPRRDMALTALAGPLANVIIAILGIFIYLLSFKYMLTHPATSQFGGNFQILVLEFLATFYWLNFSLAIFNLLPVPPLDGSRIFFSFLPPKYYFGIMRYERYIAIIFLLLLWTGVLSGMLSTLIGNIVSGISNLILLLPFF